MLFSLDEVKPSGVEIPVVYQEADLLVKGVYRWNWERVMPEMRSLLLSRCRSQCANGIEQSEECSELCPAGELVAWGLSQIRINEFGRLN